MGRLFVLFFLLPWWAYVPASLGVLWLGERVYEQALEAEARKSAALDMPMPEAVDISQFDIALDIHGADEVHVTGWMDPEISHELVRQRYGITTATRAMYPMFGPSDPDGAREVRGALMLTKTQQATFLDTGDDYIVGMTDAGKHVFSFNGFGETSATLGDLADEAFDGLGLVRDADFIFVEPFFDGREAALAPNGVPDKTRYAGWVIAAVVALFGVIKRVRSVRARPAPGEGEVPAGGLRNAAELAAYTPPPPETATSFKVPEGVSEDTPLGRLARRNAARPAAAQEEPMAYGAYGASPGAGEALHDAEMPGHPLNDEMSGLRHHAMPDDARGLSYADTDERMTVAAPGPAARPRASAAAFYVKLALGMVIVGALTYDPSLLPSTLPAAFAVLIVLVVLTRTRKRRKGAPANTGPVRGPMGDVEPESGVI